MRGIICDKCKEAIHIPGCEVKIFDEVFAAKILPADLCINCTKEFIHWLKGETIDKQTEPITFYIP